MNISIKLDGRKTSLTKAGFPIVFYLSKNSKFKRIKTGYFSEQKNWDKKNQIPKKSHPNFIELLNYLSNKKIRIGKLQEQSKTEALNFHYVERFLLQNDSGIFYLEGLKLEGVSRTYKIALNSFQKYFPDYPFKMITKEIAEEYMNLLINTPTANNFKQRSSNGVISYMNTLTAAWNKLKRPNNPFSAIRPAATRTKNKAMTPEDLIKIKNSPIAPDGNSKGGGVYNYLNYFLLCFYLGGIDMNDLAHSKWSDVVDGRLEFTRRKGGTNVFVSNKIFPEAMELLEQYNCKPYLIPLILENNYRNFIPNVSRRFQDIKEQLQLSKKPYSKAPRYTFITRAQQLLIDERITVEIVGHKQQSTHSIYKDEFPFHVRDEAHKKIIGL